MQYMKLITAVGNELWFKRGTDNDLWSKRLCEAPIGSLRETHRIITTNVFYETAETAAKPQEDL